MKCVCNDKVGWGERRPKKEQERQPTERSARPEFQGAAERGKTLEGRNSRDSSSEAISVTRGRAKDQTRENMR